MNNPYTIEKVVLEILKANEEASPFRTCTLEQ